MTTKLLFYYPDEVDTLFIIVEDILGQVGRFSTKMLADWCVIENWGTDDIGWTDISDFKFDYVSPGVYEVTIAEAKPIEPITWTDIERKRFEWLICPISQ